MLHPAAVSTQWGMPRIRARSGPIIARSMAVAIVEVGNMAQVQEVRFGPDGSAAVGDAGLDAATLLRLIGGAP
jgi:hypothetical protein